MGSQQSLQEASIPIRVLTHNIRNNSNPFPTDPEKPWSARKHYTINELYFSTIHNPESLIGLQEANHGQLLDIVNGLNDRSGKDSTWAYVGQGRGGGTHGEHSPILYRKAIWENVHDETRWLSDTPSVPSHSWGTMYKRIVTCAIFRHHKTDQCILSMNTHLDDSSLESRFKGAGLIRDWAQEWLSDPTIGSVILTGDFNTDSQSSGDAHGVLTGSESFRFSDTSAHIDSDKRYGHVSSWTDFNDSTQDDTLYDYILIGPAKEAVAPWDVRTYGVLPNQFESDTKEYIFSSDHRPVAVDLDLRIAS